MARRVGLSPERPNDRKYRAQQHVENNIDQQVGNEPKVPELGIATRDVAKEELEVSKPLAVDRVPDRSKDKNHENENRNPQADQPVSDDSPGPAPSNACVEEIGRDQKEEAHEERAIEHKEGLQEVAFLRLLHDVTPVASSDRHVRLSGVVRDNQDRQQNPDPLNVVKP